MILIEAPNKEIYDLNECIITQNVVCLIKTPNGEIYHLEDCKIIQNVDDLPYTQEQLANEIFDKQGIAIGLLEKKGGGNLG